MPLPRSGDEPFPAFLDLWEKLLLASRDPGTVVLVEGDRDRLALRRLGLPGRIELVHGGGSLSHRAQTVGTGARRVVVLTDWDTEGGHLAQRLRELLAPGPATVDLDFRRRLGVALRGELVHVEGLAGWARRAAEKAGAPLEHFLGGGATPPG